MTNKNIIIGILILGLIIGVAGFLSLGSAEDDVVSQSESASTTKQLEEAVVENNPVATSAATTTLEATTRVVEEEKAPAAVVRPAVTPKPVPEPVLAPAPVVVSGITMTEVETHDDATSCWSAIDGVVYDLTSYIPKHPGGEREILSICGGDGSKAFEGQHSGESKPERILASYKIDVLIN